MKFKKLNPKAKLKIPRDGDCGIDLYSIGEMYVAPNETFIVSTGIAVEIPDGLFGKIMERSSVGSRGIAIRGGVIDSSYRGEILVVVHNLSNERQYFHDGFAIAQLVLLPYIVVDGLEEVIELSETDRGAGGFGSTDE